MKTLEVGKLNKVNVNDNKLKYIAALSFLTVSVFVKCSLMPCTKNASTHISLENEIPVYCMVPFNDSLTGVEKYELLITGLNGFISPTVDTFKSSDCLYLRTLIACKYEPGDYYSMFCSEANRINIRQLTDSSIKYGHSRLEMIQLITQPNYFIRNSANTKLILEIRNKIGHNDEDLHRYLLLLLQQPEGNKIEEINSLSRKIYSELRAYVANH